MHPAPPTSMQVESFVDRYLQCFLVSAFPSRVPRRRLDRGSCGHLTIKILTEQRRFPDGTAFRGRRTCHGAKLFSNVSSGLKRTIKGGE